MLKLIRIGEYARGTYGVLTLWGEPIAVTLEPAWRNNERNVSCIPPGLYPVLPVDSPHFGDTYEIQSVPARSAILFHAGNTIDDTEGCILVGSSYGPFKDTFGIWNSQGTLNMLLKALKPITAPIPLEVLGCPGQNYSLALDSKGNT